MSSASASGKAFSDMFRLSNILDRYRNVKNCAVLDEAGIWIFLFSSEGNDMVGWLAVIEFARD